MKSIKQKLKSEGYGDRDVALALSLRDNMKFKQSKRMHSQRSFQGHSSQENDEDDEDDRAPSYQPRHRTPSPVHHYHDTQPTMRSREDDHVGRGGWGPRDHSIYQNDTTADEDAHNPSSSMETFDEDDTPPSKYWNPWK